MLIIINKHFQQAWLSIQRLIVIPYKIAQRKYNPLFVYSHLKFLLTLQISLISLLRCKDFRTLSIKCSNSLLIIIKRDYFQSFENSQKKEFSLHFLKNFILM